MTNASRIADRFVTAQQRIDTQTVFARGISASASDTPSTTNISTFVNALLWTWDELPDGLYVISIHGSLLMAHDAGGQVNLRLVCEGVAGTDFAVTVVAESPSTTRVAVAQGFNDVVIDDGNGATIELEFKGNVSGTTSARNPAITATAIRVG